MANSYYQTPTIPRLYTSYPLWQYANGALDFYGSPVATDEELIKLIQLDPSNIVSLDGTDRNEINLNYKINPDDDDTNMLESNLWNFNYMMVLGHNCASANSRIYPKIMDRGYNNANLIDRNTLVNYLQWGVPEYDGWSLMELSATPTAITASGQIGSIIIGSSWSPPHSPDLSVTLTHDYSGVKSTTTKGGAELTNSFYNGNPKWGDSLGAWELGQADTTQNLSRSGRKIFDISFSFLSDSDIFPETLNLATDAANNYEDDTLNTGTDDFYGQVIHKLAGSALPFIFSPNKDSTALDNFSICKFDQSSFSFQQTAPNLYSVKMKIREVW